MVVHDTGTMGVHGDGNTASLPSQLLLAAGGKADEGLEEGGAEDWGATTVMHGGEHSRREGAWRGDLTALCWR